MKYKLSLQPYSPLLPVLQPQISELPVYDNNDKIIIYIKLITAAQYFNPLRDCTGMSEKKKKTNPAQLACFEQIQWADIMAMEITEKPTNFVSHVFAAVAVDCLFLPNINTCLVTVKGWYPHFGHDFGNALLYSKSVVPNYFFIWERGI